jgi:putative ABC transport system substrate-binding protein
MKKIIALLLSTLMVVSMAVCMACSSSTENYTVGICQLVQHPALDAATQGFKDSLTEKLGNRVKFDEQNAQGDTAICAVICNQFVASKVDLIMANATPALQAAQTATNQIPILGTSITDYGTALGIENWTGTTGKNISGTSDLAPLDQQAAMIKELFPNAQKIGVLYCSAEPNSKYQDTVITGYLHNMGYNCKSYTFADSNDIQTVTRTAASECDVIYIPTDNTAASNTQIIKNICLPAKIPVVTGEAGICAGCGVATLSISYYDLGYTTGEMAYEILVEGANPATMAIRYAPKFTKLYNPEICAALGITMPSEYQALES